MTIRTWRTCASPPRYCFADPARVTCSSQELFQMLVGVQDARRRPALALQRDYAQEAFPSDLRHQSRCLEVTSASSVGQVRTLCSRP